MRTVMRGGNERKPPEIIANVHLVCTRFRNRNSTETKKYMDADYAELKAFLTELELVKGK